MATVGHLTLHKSITFGRDRDPIFLGVLNLGDQLMIAIADIEIFPFSEAEIFIELHAHSDGGAKIFKGKLEVIKQKTADDPGMSGVLKIDETNFLVQLWVSNESLRTKSMKLIFVEIEGWAKPLRPTLRARRGLVRPRKFMPPSI